MPAVRQRILLAQLPIPPAGPEPIQGNVPLAAAYLALLARRRGLDQRYAIEILPAPLVNLLGDQALVAAILRRDPWMVGFTCYLWNVERTLGIAQRLKQARPDLVVVLGGPEITADNAWVLSHSSVDYAVVGEGEQTFAELLSALAEGPRPAHAPRLSIAGLWSRGDRAAPPRRAPLAHLDEISSPYLEGILDAAEEKLLFLETVRGCAFGCKFCYYPKSYDGLYFVSREKIVANLRHAHQRGAREVVLLDPTLNQRRDFAEFVSLLAEHNPEPQFTCFGELRAEGITPQTAQWLRRANFAEVEIGLQSLDPRAQRLMNRRVNLKAFERGAHALVDAGIQLRVDLILGLPGDTADSVRRGIEYLRRSGLYTSVQVFNLSILPGTAFRHESSALGLRFQARPPYYVLQTPTLAPDEIEGLMEEAQQVFGLEYDPWPPPALASAGRDSPPGHGDASAHDARGACGQRTCASATIDLDGPSQMLESAHERTQAFTLWLRTRDFDAQRHAAAQCIRQVVADNPHTTLQVVLEPTAEPERLSTRALAAIQEACFESTSYLDLFYSLHPNRLLGAKRLFALLASAERARLGLDWVDRIGHYASIVWRDGALDETDLAAHEHQEG